VGGVPGAARRAAACTGLLGDDGRGADAGRNTLVGCGVSLSDDEVIMTRGAAVVADGMGVDCGACEASKILSSVYLYPSDPDDCDRNGVGIEDDDDLVNVSRPESTGAPYRSMGVFDLALCGRNVAWPEFDGCWNWNCCWSGEAGWSGDACFLL
jgi:hypothetical protein